VRRTSGRLSRAPAALRWTARRLGDRLGARRAERRYRERLSGTVGAARGETAVAVHAWYAELWPALAERLRGLDGHAFDLFVTVPEDDPSLASAIRREFPEAMVTPVPNRGRDVLPFLMLATELRRAGYAHVLKLHTKRSAHYSGGGAWRERLLEHLLPRDPELIAELFRVLADEATGVVGPAGEYYPLGVNYAANREAIAGLLGRTHSHEDARRIDADASHYGFFAGSMFWARLDALAPILDQRLAPADFEPERGQFDGTLAHAVERAFSLVPELDGRALYELGPGRIERLASYRSESVPEWSDLDPGMHPGG
jgi:lipopolysaccharide biosynthesis protein